MKTPTMLVLILSLAAAGACLAQEANAPEGVAAPSNARNAPYPRILPDLRVRFRVKAPDAQKVEVQLGKAYPATRGDDGFWTVTTDPQVAGFHYYFLLIDGVTVSDPASKSYFGYNKESSGIEIPEPGVDYYLPKNVPHGEVRERWFHSNITGAWRRIMIYTPPAYDTSPDLRYPVLYLQHGAGEDERGWSNQGHLNFIMDNLLAEGKIRPMLVVMSEGYAQRAGDAPQDNTRTFGEVLVHDVIPLVDASYRTLPDREHRAMAGLSMGGGQTFAITLSHLDTFSYIGGFSGAGGGFSGGGNFDPKTANNGVMADAAEFNRKVHLVFMGIGTAEDKRMYDGVKNYREALEKAGIKTVYYESPGTAHEWLTWRRCIHEFAPLLFKTGAAAGEGAAGK